MGVKCGIVGLPNVGKSTLFNCLTNSAVAAENYPFCTIEPNLGLVKVPDLRLAKIAEIVKPINVIPTTVEFVDIAGLVAGASKGEGLGNKFLAHIRETDAILHVVRCFTNKQILHVANQINPIDDISIINTELSLADLETINKCLLRLQKSLHAGDKAAQHTHQILEYVKPLLNQGLPIRSLNLTEQDKLAISSLNLLTAKPMLYVANVGEHGEGDQQLLDAVMQLAQAEKSMVIPICAAVEEQLLSLDEEEKKLFLSDMQVEEPGLDRLIRAGYSLLKLETFFTAGVKEVRAWTIHQHSTAPQAAGVIHSDFAKGFIRAEVISYADFLSYCGEQGAKEAGKLRLEGKEYIVQDGDIMFFRFKV